MCTMSKDVGIKDRNAICSPSKESIIGHRYERTNMVAKCEMFMNCNKTFIGICKKQNDCQTRYTLGIIDVRNKYDLQI